MQPQDPSDPPDPQSTTRSSPSTSWLVGGGKMGELVAAKDWSVTPLGPIDRWPQSLRTTVSLALASNFPISIAWGPQRVQIYNDGYWPICGAKHPRSLGQDFKECWSSAWPAIGEAFESATAGKTAFLENQRMFLDRHGYLEETFFTFSFSPIRDESGRVAGLFHPVTEMTAQTLAERRLQVLREVSDEAVDAQSVDEASEQVVRTLSRHQLDVPFALIYLLDGDGSAARLAGASHLEHGSPAAPRSVELDAAQQTAWPLARAARMGAAIEVGGLAESFGDLACGPYPESPYTAMVLPISVAGLPRPLGFVVAGASPRRPFDAVYRTFYIMLQEAVTNCLVNARSYEVERKRAEQLAELDRAKTAFFSNVSHEFRTPLTLMLGPIEDLLAAGGGRLGRAERSQLELVHRNALRLLRLVNTMLDFSRIEAGRVEASYQPTDIASLTAELASSFRSACERAALKLIVDSPPLSHPVYVDRDMWEKIVLNLISNAFKYTLQGEIEVRLAETESGARLTVRDTGVGIPPDALPRMFERFYRVPRSEGRTHEGSGIGLALVQELVKLHGGEVHVESEQHRGSRFSVTVPFGTAHLDPKRIGSTSELQSTAISSAAFVEEALRWLPGTDEDVDVIPGPSMEETPPPPESVVPAGPRLRVLWADDNADMRRYVARLLGSRFEVEAVADGEAAMEAARREPPDLVLTDVMMPRMDGFELLAALRADAATADIPVILLSARAGEESRIEGMRAGADDYVVKPFTARELLARVETHAKTARMRRDTKRAVVRAAAQFKTLLDRAPLGVYVVDADFKISDANPIAARVFAKSPDEAVAGDVDGVIGRDFDDVLRRTWPAEYAHEISSIFRHTLETGESYVASERAEVRLDRGVTEYYEWRVDRIPLADGRHGVVCYFRDISAHVHARRAIEESREALREADRRKDRFLATLSHELRNPLAPLRTALDIAKMTDDAAATFPVMERQLEQLTRLVDDLLNVSRVTQGKLQLRLDEIELNSIVKSATEDVADLIAAARHELIVQLPDEPIVLCADAIRLGQVITNLLTNAAKYTPQGGRIVLAAKPRADGVEISVKDNGIGIPPEKLEAVFEMFSQLDDGTLGRDKGLGIGLSLVKTLVQMHGGNIEARSEGAGKGSEFAVWLPQRLQTTPKPVASGAARASAGNESVVRRVLIVDDNRDAAEALATLVQMQGHEARTAFAGLAGVALAEEFRPHLAFLDIGLPDIDGYEVARRIRVAPWSNDVFLAALTGWAQDRDRERAKEAGFDTHVTKPLTLDALQGLLDELAS